MEESLWQWCHTSIKKNKKKTVPHTSPQPTSNSHFLLSADFIEFIALPPFPHTYSTFHFASLPAQPDNTERRMLLLLYRPLKITHPSLPSTAGLTASCSQ